jgi:cytochrome P450
MDASPSLGKNFDPFGQHLEEPFSFYAQLRQEEPVTFSPVLNAYLISRFEDVRAILSQPDVFSSRATISPVGTFYPQTLVELSKGYPFTRTSINSDGAAHKRLREPLRKAFSPLRIRALEPFIRQRIQQLLDRFLGDGHAEIISQFAFLLPLDVIITQLGIPSEDREQVKSWCDDWTALVMSPLSEEEQVACARNLLIFHRYLLERIEERRLAPREDVLTGLATMQLPGEEAFSEAELINIIGGLMIAGHITTTHLIGTGLVRLLQEPERWRTLCEHPEFIPQTIEEILRYDGPVRGFMRVTTRPVTSRGIELPEETRLFLLYNSANRDEEQFAEADRFQMLHQPNQHVAFGYGAHFCLGAPLARLQGRLAFEALTRQLPTLRLVPGQHLVHHPDLVNYGYRRVEVEW